MKTTRFLCAAFAAVSCLAATSSAVQEGRTPIPPAPAIVRVIVVDAGTDAPVQGAEVVALSETEVRRSLGARAGVAGPLDWYSVLDSRPPTATTDARGQAEVPGSGTRVFMSARSKGSWGQASVEGGGAGPVRIGIEPDRTLRVRVRDEHGAGCAGIELSAVMKYEGPSVGESDSSFDGFANYLGQATTNAEGVATLRHAQSVFESQEHAVYRIQFAFPVDPVREIKIDPLALPVEPVDLVLPPTGSVIVPMPDGPMSYAQLRIAPKDGGEPARFWFERQGLLRAAPIDGRARFQHVGLGLELEYEGWWDDGLSEPVRARARGPVVAGEEITLPALGVTSLPTVTGRIVDENGDPICSRELSVSITETTRSSSSSNGIKYRTDDSGRFHITLSKPTVPEGYRRYLEFSCGYDEESKRRFENAEARIELPGRIEAPLTELGEIVFAAPGSPSRFKRMDDAALEIHYRACQRDALMNGYWQRDVEACLVEMARRGGSPWITFLSNELAAVRKPATLEKDRATDVHDLELLTALRRAQRKADPMTIEVDGESVREMVFPSAPEFTCRIANVDVEGESFFVTHGGSYRSGRFGRCRIDAVDDNGLHVAPVLSPGIMGGGFYTRGKLEPGKGEEFSVPLQQYVQLPHPGTYRVRIQLHDDKDIDEEADIRGLIVSSSRELTVVARVPRLEITKIERESFAKWIAALDVNQPVPLVSGHWNPSLTFHGEATSPEDKLFRAGWKAMPALLDALEDPAVDRNRRAWALGMLWNISGVYSPSTAFGAIGKMRWITTWPSSDVPAQPSMAEFGEISGHEVWASSQDELAKKWLALRAWFEVTEKK